MHTYVPACTNRRFSKTGRHPLLIPLNAFNYIKIYIRFTILKGKKSNINCHMASIISLDNPLCYNKSDLGGEFKWI